MQQAQQLRANGGIMTIPRQKYGLGKLVKKVGRAVKKVAKSPIGRLAIAVAAPYALGPAMANAQFLAGLSAAQKAAIISGATGDANSSNNRVAVSAFLSSTSYQANMNVNFLDSPSTTSATTYDIRGTHGRNNSVTFYAGRENTTATSNDRMRSAQFLTLMEVAA